MTTESSIISTRLHKTKMSKFITNIETNKTVMIDKIIALSRTRRKELWNVLPKYKKIHKINEEITFSNKIRHSCENKFGSTNLAIHSTSFALGNGKISRNIRYSMVDRVSGTTNDVGEVWYICDSNNNLIFRPIWFIISNYMDLLWIIIEFEKIRDPSSFTRQIEELRLQYDEFRPINHPRELEGEQHRYIPYIKLNVIKDVVNMIDRSFTPSSFMLDKDKYLQKIELPDKSTLYKSNLSLEISEYKKITTVDTSSRLAIDLYSSNNLVENVNIINMDDLFLREWSVCSNNLEYGLFDTITKTVTRIFKSGDTSPQTSMSIVSKDSKGNIVYNAEIDEDGKATVKTKKRNRRKSNVNYGYKAVLGQLQISDENCAMCLETVNTQEGTILNCGHIFHKKCFRRKMKKCPSCRQPVTSNRDLKLNTFKYREKLLLELIIPSSSIVASNSYASGKLRTNKAIPNKLYKLSLVRDVIRPKIINFSLSESDDTEALSFVYKDDQISYELGTELHLSGSDFDGRLEYTCVPGIHYCITPREALDYHLFEGNIVGSLDYPPPPY